MAEGEGARLEPTLLGSARPRAASFEHGRRHFRGLARAHDYEALELEGQLPEALRGLLIRNGPGAYESYGRRYGHWFDGDGAITAIELQGGQARGALRFVETPDRVEEAGAGRALLPGFGTRPPDLRAYFRSIRERRVKNAANTNVIVWQRRMLALHEGSLPIELELDSLRSLGPTQLDVLDTCMSAHPHRVAARRCTYNFGLELGRHPCAELYAFPDEGPARRLGNVALPGSMMVHDFMATERHLVFLLCPVYLRLAPMVFRGHSYVEALRWRPERGTEVLVVPIDDPSAVTRFVVEPHYLFHFANAFESGDGRITVDFVHYPDFPIINRWLTELIEPGPVHTAIDGTLVRGQLDLRRESLELEPLLESCEFPRVAPAVEGGRHRFAYLAAHAQREGVRPGAQDHLVKYDFERGEQAVWDFGPETYPSEPVFVPDPARAGDEDGGWLLSVVYDGSRDRSCLGVVDAGHPEAGVLARAWFDHHVPPSFHGNWVGA